MVVLFRKIFKIIPKANNVNQSKYYPNPNLWDKRVWPLKGAKKQGPTRTTKLVAFFGSSHLAAIKRQLGGGEGMAVVDNK